MERPTCGTCPYWDDFTDDDGDGQCRRFPASLPPTESLVQEGYDLRKDDNALTVGWWPVVMSFDWCGEHPGFGAYLATLKAVEPEGGG